MTKLWDTTSIGEPRADNRHCPLHSSLECISHSVPQGGAEVAQLVDPGIASSRLPHLIRRLKLPRGREVVDHRPQSTSQGVDLGGQQIILKPFRDQNRGSDDGKENEIQQQKHNDMEDLPWIFSSRVVFSQTRSVFVLSIFLKE